MRFFAVFSALTAGLLPAVLADSAKGIDGALLGPLSASSRWIVDANGKRVKMRCANWGGHMEMNIPEGLSKQPVEHITSWLASNNFNCVRLTYSIDMALNPDQTVEDSFNKGVSTGVQLSDLQAMYKTAVGLNPWLANSTVQGAFTTVIKSLGDKGIRVVLDNHVSKASWCCNYNDGNGWWDQAAGYVEMNSKYFNTDNWIAGLVKMAAYANAFPNVVGMSLRNELRPFIPQDFGFNHADWYKFVTKGAQSIHAANSNVFIVIGGTQSATEIRFLHDHPLDTSSWGAAKTVWEFHVYPWSFALTDNCGVLDAQLGWHAGFLLIQGQGFTGPLWLSEFGVGMTGGPHDGLSDADSGYLGCLASYMQGNDADWAVWAVQGSYYVRNGQLNYDESYGLLDSNWNDWRNPKFPAMLGSMWNITQGP